MSFSIKDVNGNLKPTEQLLNETADAFEKYADGAAKSNVAQQLFGRAGADLITFLDGGSKSLNQLRQEADEFGLTILGTVAPAAEQFNDHLSRMEALVSGVGNSLEIGRAHV